MVNLTCPSCLHRIRSNSVLVEISCDLPATLPAIHRRWRHLLDHRGPDTHHQRAIPRRKTIMHGTASNQAFSVVGLGLSILANEPAAASFLLVFRPALAAVWGLCGAGFGLLPHWPQLPVLP